MQGRDSSTTTTKRPGGPSKIRALMRPKLAGLSVALTVAVCALLPAAASAGLNRVVGDCYAHTRLTQHYTVPQLEQALNNIPADIAEYSNCSDVIREALDQQLGIGGHGASGKSGGSSFLPAWLIVLIVLVVIGGGGATVAARRRAGGGDPPPLSS